MGAGRRLTVVGGVVVVFVVAGGCTRSSGLAVVCWSLSSLPAFFESLGGWRRFGRTALWCCRWRDVAFGRHAPRVVDAGDVGVWLSDLLVGWLSCFVGDVGRQWWWGLLVGRVVARRARCG